MERLLNISHHAVSRYSIRTGTPMYNAALLLRHEINDAKPINAETACEYFPIAKVNNQCSYLMWINKTIKEHVLAIIKNDTVLTVITQNMFGLTPRRAKKWFIPCDEKMLKIEPRLVKVNYAQDERGSVI